MAVKAGATGLNEDAGEGDGVVGRVAPLHMVRVIRGCMFRQQENRAGRTITFTIPHKTSWSLFCCLTVMIGQGLNEVWKPRLRCFSFMACEYPWAVMVIEGS